MSEAKPVDPITAPEESKYDDLEIPDEVMRVYSDIPAKVQLLINDAGMAAKSKGLTLELQIGQLRALTYLTADDVYYASLLQSRGESSESVVNILLTRAEHLVSNTPIRISNAISPRGINNIDTSLGRSQQTRAMGNVAPLSRRSRGHPKPQITKTYGKVVSDYTKYKQISRDFNSRPQKGPVKRRSRSVSPSPEVMRRHELVGKLQPNTIAGSMMKSSNAGASLRSQSYRIPPVRPATTQVQYSIPGLADDIRVRNRGRTYQSPFGTTSPNTSSSYLPSDVHRSLSKESKKKRLAKLTAAATLDADALIHVCNSFIL